MGKTYINPGRNSGICCKVAIALFPISHQLASIFVEDSSKNLTGTMEMECDFGFLVEDSKSQSHRNTKTVALLCCPL